MDYEKIEKQGITEELKVDEGEKPEIGLISVFDNYQVNPELKADWGFATVVKTPKELILFDTGSSPEVLLSNMENLVLSQL